MEDQKEISSPLMIAITDGDNGVDKEGERACEVLIMIAMGMMMLT